MLDTPTAEDQRSPRILISRMSAIGDAILTLPVACALRQHFPDAYLGWVIEKKAAPMVRGHQALDALVELERGWFTSLAGLRDARRRLQAHRFDISIDCQGLTKSALAGWLSGARERIGYAGRHGGELSRWLNNDLVHPAFTHLTDRSLELLVPLEIHSPAVRWQLPLAPSARRWALRWRRSIASPCLAILNPGATWASKVWQAERFAETAKYLRDRYGYRCVVVWGSFEDRLMAEQIVALSDSAAALAPDTDLPHLAALIETADLFIS